MDTRTIFVAMSTLAAASTLVGLALADRMHRVDDVFFAPNPGKLMPKPIEALDPSLREPGPAPAPAPVDDGPLTQPLIEQRCTENNLDPPQADLRNAWATKCFPDKMVVANEVRSVKLYALVYDATTNNWIGPLDPNAPCGSWQFKALCVASCYTPEQRVLFEHGYVPIIEATESLLPSVVTLRPESSLDELSFQLMPVATYTRSWQDGSEVVRIFEMKSGGRLRVTQNHPMVTSEGMVKPAFDVGEGESLIRATGEFDPIVSIRDELYFGKVYNLAPASNNALENIVVAEGYLNGSANYQYNQLFVDLQYRKLLRESIAEGALQ